MRSRIIGIQSIVAAVAFHTESTRTTVRAAVDVFLVLSLLVAAAVPSAAQMPPPAVIVAPATMQAIDRGQTFNGRIVAEKKVELRARVGGLLEARSFIEGAPVKAGAMLFEIEPAPYQAALEEVDGKIQAAQAEKRLADLEVERQRELVARRTASQAQLDRAIANAGVQEGNLAQLEAARKSAALDLSYALITAPFDGRIGLASVDVGDYVNQGSGTLATLTSIDPIDVELHVAQSTVLDFEASLADGTFKNAPAATLTLSNGKTYETRGKLSFVDVSVATGTDTVTLRYRFENPAGRLLDGQLVGVSLEAQNDEPVLTVPVEALQRDQAGTFVMVVDAEDMVARRDVVVSRREGTVAIVAEGLKPGERVVTGGLNKIRPGIKVDAAPAPSPSGR